MFYNACLDARDEQTSKMYSTTMYTRRNIAPIYIPPILAARHYRHGCPSAAAHP